MTVFIALLRAVNVGGTGKLPMGDLKAICESAGFGSVRTHIASGNVLFTAEQPEAEVKTALASALAAYAGKPVGVLLRTVDEMAAVLGSNPFPEAPPSRTVAIFLDEPPGPDALGGILGQVREEVRTGRREIYVHYRDGIGKSRLTIPAARSGTARNMNTVARLVEIARDLGGGGPAR